MYELKIYFEFHKSTNKILSQDSNELFSKHSNKNTLYIPLFEHFNFDSVYSLRLNHRIVTAEYSKICANTNHGRKEKWEYWMHNSHFNNAPLLCLWHSVYTLRNVMAVFWFESSNYLSALQAWGSQKTINSRKSSLTSSPFICGWVSIRMCVT